MISPKDAVSNVIAAARNKLDMLETNFIGYLISSIIAGIFIGFGILLVFTISGQLEGAPFTKLIMGMCFVCALSLVVVAGAELFTGNNFVMGTALFKGYVRIIDALKLWGICWIGNFIGSFLLAWIFYQTGLAKENTFLAMHNATLLKTSIAPIPLFMRAVLCNVLVCLAIWCTFRTQSVPAQLIMVFWCIVAFFVTGFEHSVANMTLFSIEWFTTGTHSLGCLYNLLVVTLGNMVGGILGVALPYHLITK